MTEFKLVISTHDGKSYQKEIKSPEADNLLKKRIGDKISGDSLGYSGYEFEITGGSDKCGFPMRKGIQLPRKMVLLGKSVGFSGKNRNKKKQKGLIRRKTVCGELVTKIIRQVNLKVLKEGSAKLGEAAEEKPAEETPEAKEEKTKAKPAEEKKEEVKPEAAEEKPKEEPKLEEKAEKPEPK